MTASKMTALAGMVVVLIILVLTSWKLLEPVDAGEMMVVQSPIKGTLTWHTTPGMKWQGFGKVTTYRKELRKNNLTIQC